ncbi:hypothetical protein LINPERPRIM_LOCUS37758 [Linum perenne]
MKKVPPILINPEGISWLASQIGRPINKFVWDGLDIKVCVVKDVLEEMKKEIVVELDEDEFAAIAIEVPELRKYRETGVKRWVVSSGKVDEISSSGKGPKASPGAEGSPEASTSSVAEGSSSQKKTAGVSFGPSDPVPVNSTVDDAGVIVSEDDQDSEVGEKDEPIASANVRLGTASFGDFFIPNKLVSPKGIVTKQWKSRRR